MRYCSQHTPASCKEVLRKYQFAKQNVDNLPEDDVHRKFQTHVCIIPLIKWCMLTQCNKLPSLIQINFNTKNREKTSSSRWGMLEFRKFNVLFLFSTSAEVPSALHALTKTTTKHRQGPCSLWYLLYQKCWALRVCHLSACTYALQKLVWAALHFSDWV